MFRAKQKNTVPKLGGLTCDDQALVVVQGLGEEPRDDELGVDDEADLLLDQAGPRDPASHHPVCEVHLPTHAKLAENATV